MEYFIKQTSRVKFADQQSTEASGSFKERRTVLQKSPSFKEEKKRPQNWSRRQISWQMNQDYDSNGNGIDKATAVAAAAYAIATLEDSFIPPPKRISSEPSLTRIKSRKEDQITVSRPEPGESSRKIHPEIQESQLLFETENAGTREKSPDRIVDPDSSMKKTPTFVDKLPSLRKRPSFSDKPVIMNKIPTFSEEQLNRSDDNEPVSPPQHTTWPYSKHEIEEEIEPPPKPDWIIPPNPAISPAKVDKESSPESGIGGTEADAWEKAELARIRKKYAALEERILSWENKKKTKSRRRLDKAESNLEKKRMKALDTFRSEMEDINQIAEGARSKARKEQQHEESKAKEKASKFRKTGKRPTTCVCF